MWWGRRKGCIGERANQTSKPKLPERNPSLQVRLPFPKALSPVQPQIPGFELVEVVILHISSVKGLRA